jgi:leucyl-tRNA synthetase
MVQSGKFTGLRGGKNSEGVRAVIAELEAQGRGHATVNFRLRDWLISRQRYWGNPIPAIYCPHCGLVPVPEADLPVILPLDLDITKGQTLAEHPEFYNVKCPVCGADARRETDTMDTFTCSSWYYLRYTDARNDSAPWSKEAADYWMPADQYIGGIEHAILHLLYARFWTKAMRDLGLVPIDEPFTRLLTQGMVLNHIYSRKNEKGGIEYFWPHDVEPVLDEGGKQIGAKLNKPVGDLPAGTPIVYEGVGTMSKSKNNGVDPQELIEKYGADTARLYTMFTAPPEATLEWNDAAVEGSYRFLRRVWNFGVRLSAIENVAGLELSQPAKALRREIHTVLGQVDYDYQRMQYNTVVSGAMKMLNALEAFSGDGSQGSRAALAEGFSILLRVLYPATPHLTHALWRELGFAAVQGELLDAPWPTVDEQALQQDEIELMLQINGKLRGAIRVPAQADKAQIEAAALASETFAKHAQGAQPKKVIVVPGRLVNVVV